jgi:hypothetical protein
MLAPFFYITVMIGFSVIFVILRKLRGKTHFPNISYIFNLILNFKISVKILIFLIKIMVILKHFLKLFKNIIYK